jgi:hypothetical protein
LICGTAQPFSIRWIVNKWMENGAIRGFAGGLPPFFSSYAGFP